LTATPFTRTPPDLAAFAASLRLAIPCSERNLSILKVAPPSLSDKLRKAVFSSSALTFFFLNEKAPMRSFPPSQKKAVYIVSQNRRFVNRIFESL
jgi:hypothetical protein